MLRATLLVIGGGMLAAAAFGALAAWRLSAIIPLAVWGAIFAGGVLVERWRYRPLSDDWPGGGWHAIQERFVDPESGRLVTVFLIPRPGSGAMSPTTDAGSPPEADQRARQCR